MIELEKTYLAKYLPDDLESFRFTEIIDIYFPKSSSHPKIRLRKKGDKYQLTKKQLIDSADASEQQEQTINLTEYEFNELKTHMPGKVVHKLRYYYNHSGLTYEFDIFQGSLSGLVLIEIEFPTSINKSNFQKPDFCLDDVTQELFIAGGMLCGKSYQDIETALKKFNYTKLFIPSSSKNPP
jgi:CYTH domain-containing protein